ncbi:hypothetical protein GCM10007301_35100 [Azorhizobium oxalatiphilum]|uniref:PIN domain-containing protein n=1 Tax=Azorhizobium oxalatiphilum TaxID=980631 RepID=A0A917C4V9_9HYPH|nr:type II toxin-antitoxin system VapC family toxin [Azorhizobium oxalatiphilum]GGF72285.1 hypothetical protein GCM10007301_35100 [Azorhizobium oxalatiphilum]
MSVGMMGLDTNILLRALLKDDARQSPAAARVLEGLTPEAPGYVNMAVLLEVMWTLSRRYKASRAELMATLEGLLESPGYVLADREAVIDGLEIMQAEKLDFADAMIGALNQRAGCEATWTFDAKASTRALFQRVES